MGMSESKKQLVIYFNMQDFCDAPASAIWAAVKNDVQGAYGKKNPNRYCKTRKRERETRMQKDGNQNFLIMHLSAQQTQQKKKRARSSAQSSGREQIKNENCSGFALFVSASSVRALMYAADSIFSASRNQAGNGEANNK
jgi:hypothetical protein